MDLQATVKDPKHQCAEYRKLKHSEKACREINAPDLVDRKRFTESEQASETPGRMLRTQNKEDKEKPRNDTPDHAAVCRREQ